MSDSLFYPILWFLIVAGLVPSLWFVYSWRPSRRWSARALDAGGWVAIIAALYLLAALRAALGHYREPASLADAIATFTIAGAVDLVLWLRVLRWRQFQQHPTHPLRRSTDPGCECPTDDDEATSSTP